jgi:hypothetical protein
LFEFFEADPLLSSFGFSPKCSEGLDDRLNRQVNWIWRIFLLVQFLLEGSGMVPIDFLIIKSVLFEAVPRVSPGLAQPLVLVLQD